MLKDESSTGVFLLTLRNFKELIFWSNTSGGYLKLSQVERGGISMSRKIVKDCFCFDYAEIDFGIRGMEDLEAVTQRCSYEKVFWKYAANLQENTEVRFQQSCKATLLKSHFGMGVLL